MSLKIPVIGIGNPLMDTISHVDYSVLQELNAEPGSMNLVTEEELQKVLAKIGRQFVETPGGSCANTMRGLAWLLSGEEDFANPVYTGAIGKDTVGVRLKSGLSKIGVTPELPGKQDSHTGVSTILVTPDNERTMFTSLGACRDYGVEDFPISQLDNRPVWLHIAGYMWDTENQKKSVKFAVQEALKRHVKISFDLADPFVVERYGADFQEWLPGRIDLLFANRTELASLTGMGPDDSDEEILEKAGKYGETIVMKVGKKGCWVSRRGYSIHFPCVDIAPPTDTTGAGDSFAAGFLYGIVKGETFHDCADIANRIASGIVTVEGCDYSTIDRNYVLGK